MGNFKYLAIVDWAKKQIAEKNMGNGAPFYSENELCDIHNVSRQTVRQALAMLENEGIIERKRGSGSFVKGSVRAKRTEGSVIGVVSTYFSDYIFPKIVTGLEQVIRKHGSTMQLSITQNLVSEEKNALKAMLDRHVDGIIVEPSKSALPNPNMDLYEEIRREGIPIVFFNAKYPWTDSPCVSMNDERASEIATDYLFGLGHEKIKGIFSLEDIQGHKRYAGFMKSFTKHGRDDAEKSVLWYGSAQRKAIFDADSELVGELVGDATAVVCYNDDIAVKLLEFCRIKGIRVPEDLSVIGMDDSRLASVCEVPLTTVKNSPLELGELAAERLLGMMETGKTSEEDILIEPQLVIRSSTKELYRAK